jgi:hypothetical protein
VSPGGRLEIGARVPAFGEVFDAWAVVLTPNGEVYSLMPEKAPVPGAVPLARSVNGLWADIEVSLFDGLVPAGMPGGTATVAAGIFHPGTVPGSLDDARRQAVAGYYDQKTVTIAP